MIVSEAAALFLLGASMTIEPVDPAAEAAPQGLRNRLIQLSESAAQPEDPTEALRRRINQRSDAWYTGRNLQGTESGWSTPFYEKWFKQQEAAAAKGTVQDFSAKDATGIVTTDHGRRLADGEREFKFGDIYNDGELVGNVYESYGEDADMLMAPLVLDENEQRRVFEGGDISKAVATKRELFADEYDNFLARKEYEEEVQARAEAYRDSGWGTGSVVAGALGGAAAGAVGGIPGIIAGAILGGAGAWLNEDEILRNLATTEVQAEMVSGGAAMFHRLSGWSQAASQMSSPLTNLTHGFYDSIEGTRGDAVAQWYEVDEEGNQRRPGWVTAIGLASGFADAALSFSSAPASALFRGSMMGSAIGQTGSLIFSGGRSFSDRHAAWDEIYLDDQGRFSPIGVLAGVGNVGIDAIQSLRLGAFSDFLRNQQKAMRGESTVMAGTRFTRDAATGEMKARLTASVLAPSELVSRLNVTVAAMRNTQKARGALTADDLYRAALDLQQGTGALAWRRAVVEGIGEGMEEATQAILEPLSHAPRDAVREAMEAFGNSSSSLGGFLDVPGAALGALGSAGITAEDVAMSYAQGAMMGAGMSFGGAGVLQRALSGLPGSSTFTGFDRSFDKDQVAKAFMVQAANHERGLNGLPPLTMEEGLAMTDEELTEQAGGVLNTELYRNAGMAAASAMTKELVASTPAIEAAYDLIAARVDSDTKGILPATSETYRAILMTNAKDVRPEGAYASIRTVRQMFSNNLRSTQAQAAAIQQQLAAATDPAEQAALQSQLEHAQQVNTLREGIIAYLRQAEGAARNASNEGHFRAIINGLNQRLASDYDAISRIAPNDPQADEAKALSRAATVLLARNPQDKADSVQAFLPQVHIELERHQDHYAVASAESRTKGFSLDFDGDNLQQKAGLILDDQQWANLRAGFTHIGSEMRQVTDSEGNTTVQGVLGSIETYIEMDFEARDYEAFEIQNISEALAVTGKSPLATFANGQLRLFHQEVESYFSYLPRKAISKALNEFEANLKAGDANARQRLLSRLIVDNGNQVAESSYLRQRMEIVWLNQRIHLLFQNYQRLHASVQNKDVDFTGGFLEIAKPTREGQARQRLFANTIGETMHLLFQSGDSFRDFGNVAYTDDTSRADRVVMEDDPIVATIQRLYAEASRRDGATELEKIDAPDKITGSVLTILNKMARPLLDHVASTTGLPLTLSEAMLAIATMQVQDVYSTGKGADRTFGVRGTPISFAQLMLRQAVWADQNENAAILDRNTELQARHEALLSMTSGDKGALLTLAEIFSHQITTDWAGADAAHFGLDVTNAQVVRSIMAQPEDVTRDSRALVRQLFNAEKDVFSDPPYSIDDIASRKVNLQQVMIEALFTKAANEISMGADGIPTGRLGEASKRTQREIESLAKSLSEGFRAFKDQHTHLKLDPTKRESWDLFFQFNKPMANAFYKTMLSSGLSARVDIVTKADGTTQMILANGVYDILQKLDNPKEFAMEYLRQMIYAQYLEAMNKSESETLGYSSLQSRWSQLLFRLAAADDGGLQLRMFQAVLDTATDVDTFIKTVNDQWLGGEPLYTAFLDDVSGFDPGKSGGGWTHTVASAEHRRTVSEAARQAQQASVELQARAQIANADVAFVNQLADARKDEKRREDIARQKGHLDADGNPIVQAPTSSTTGLENLRKFRHLLSWVGDHGDILGPGAIIEELVGAASGFFDAGHDKGKVPAYVSPEGDYYMQMILPTFDTASGQAFASATVFDLEEIRRNPRRLLKPFDTIAPDGTPIRWGGLTEDKFFELWASPEYRPLLTAAITPTVHEVNPLTGTLERRNAVADTIEAVVNFDRDKAWDQDLSNDLNFLATLDSLARTETQPYPILEKLNKTVVAYTERSTKPLGVDDFYAVAEQAIKDVARSLRAAGKYYARNGAGSEHNLSDMLRQQAFVKSMTDILPELTGKTIKELEAYADLIDAALRDQNQKALAQHLAATKAILDLKEGQPNYDQLQEMLTMENVQVAFQLDRSVARASQLLRNPQNNEVIQEIVSIDWSNDALAELDKTTVIVAIRDDATRALARKVNPRMVEVFDQILNTEPGKTPVLHPTKKEDKALWDELAATITTARLQMRFHPGALMPGELYDPSVESWDTSWRYLASEELQGISNPLVKAATDWAVESMEPSADATDRWFLREVLSSTLNHERLSTWTPEIPKRTQNANNRLYASGARTGVQAAGSSPKTKLAETVITDATTDVLPLAGTMSRIAFNPRQLVTGDPYALLRVDNALGGTDPTQLPVAIVKDGAPLTVPGTLTIAELNGRFINEATITYVDSNGVAQSVNPLERVPFDPTDPDKGDLVSNFGISVPSLETLDAAGLRIITVDKLIRDINSIVPQDAADVSIELSIALPQSKPVASTGEVDPTHANNIVYDGWAMEATGTDTAGLTTEAYFTAGGINSAAQRVALEAMKKALVATPFAKAMDEKTKTEAEGKFLTDMASVIRTKATWLTYTDHGTGKLWPAAYNNMAKILKLQHGIRGLNANNEPEYWDAERVIAYQAANPGADPTTFPLKNAELVVLSPEALLAIFGDPMAMGFRSRPASTATDPVSAVRTYEGITTELVQTHLPGLLRIDSNGSFQTGDFALLNAMASGTRNKLFQGYSRSSRRGHMLYTRGMAKAQETAQQVMQARAQASNREEFDRNKRDLSQVFLGAIGNNWLSVDMSRTGYPFQLNRDAHLSILETMHAKELLQTINFRQNSALMVFDARTSFESEHPSSGTLTTKWLDPEFRQKQKGGEVYTPVIGDLIMFELAAYQGSEKTAGEWYEIARSHLMMLAQNKANILIVDSTGSSDLRHELGEFMLADLGFSRAPGAKNLFVPNWQHAGGSASLAAQRRTLTSVALYDPAGTTIGFASENVDGLFEQAAAVIDADALPRISTPSPDLIPSGVVPGFNPPQDATVVESVKDTLREIVKNDDLLKTLYDQQFLGTKDSAPTDEKVLARRLRRFKQDVEAAIRDYEYPMLRIGAERHQGTMYFEVSQKPFDSSSRVIRLVRHGYKPVSEKSLKEQLKTEAPGKGGAKLGVVVDTGQRQAGATIREGRVEGYVKDRDDNYRVVTRTELGIYGGKITHESSAFKATFTPMPQHIVMPGTRAGTPGRIFNGNSKSMALLYNLDDVLGKQAHRSLVIDHGSAFAMFGVDFMPRFVRALHPSLSASSTSKEWQEAENQTRRFFQDLKNLDHGLTDDVLAEISRATANPRFVVGSGVLDLLRKLNSEYTDQVLEALTNATYRTPDQHALAAATIYMLSSGANLSNIEGTGGVASLEGHQKARAIRMPDLFTSYFDFLPWDTGKDENNNDLPSIRKELNEEFNSRFANINGDGAHLTKDFKLVTRAYKTDKAAQAGTDASYVSGYLFFDQTTRMDEDPTFLEQSAARTEKENQSLHSTAVDYATLKARIAGLPEFGRFQEELNRSRDGKITDATSMTSLLRKIDKDDTPSKPWFRLTSGHKWWIGKAQEITFQGRQPITFREETPPAEIEKYHRLRGELLNALGLPSGRGLDVRVDYWVRQYLGRPADEDGTAGWITADEAAQITREMLANVTEEKRLPVVGKDSRNPLFHAEDLALLYVYNNGPNPRWTIMTEGSVETSFDEWVKIAFGQAATVKLPAGFALHWIDGHMHSYARRLEPLVGPVVSIDEVKIAQLSARDASEVSINLRDDAAIDRNTATLLERPIVLGATSMTYEDMLDNGSLVAGQDLFGNRSSNTALGRKDRAEKAHAKKRGISEAKSTTMIDHRQLGREYIENIGTGSQVMMMLSNIHTFTSLLNPALAPAQFLETTWIETVTKAVNVLRGGGISGLKGTWGNRTSTDDVARLKTLARTIGERLKERVYEELSFRPEDIENVNRATRMTQKAANYAARIQNIFRGQSGQTLGERYIAGVMAEIEANPTRYQYDVDQLVASLTRDPDFLLKNSQHELDMAGMRKVAEARSMRQTSAVPILDEMLAPFVDSRSALVRNFTQLFVMMPLKFKRIYGLNLLKNVTGAHALDAVVASGLHGRTLGPIGLWQKFFRYHKYDPDAKIDMNYALEGLDLTDAFIRTGISHASMFAIGSLLYAGGLTGEDEEDRRRRRLARMNGMNPVFDPRKVQNDWRNAEAVYIEADHPLLGWMAPLFTPNGETGALANVHWTVKPILSPLLGMARFFENGNPQELLWGFEDAVGSMPLINQNTWAAAVTTFEELTAQAAEAQAGGSDVDLSNAYALLISAVTSLESMIFENAFINSIYQTLDTYDRDPWVYPEIGPDGIMLDETGQPLRSDAMQSYVDPETGEVRQAYLSRGWADGTLRSLTENRAGLALFASLIPGVSGGGWFMDSDVWRQNMAVKERKISLEELGEDAAALALLNEYAYVSEMQEVEFSTWDSNLGEVLTDIGADAVIRGLWKGAVDFDSPALEGVYISYETRKKITTEWAATLLQEGLDMGLSRTSAERRRRRIMDGDYNNPDVVGLNDIIWSDKIPMQPSLKYRQLNTTYTVGPDGYPMATGVARGNWFDAIGAAFGILGLQRYYTSGEGQLDQDGRLNAVDDVLGINTGLRAVERIEETWDPRKVEAAIEEAVKEATDKEYTTSNDPDYDYYSGSRGGGGGGYSRTPARMGTPVRSSPPYADSTPNINTSNPYVRRASLRRERFSSDRGRLKPWQ